MRREAFIYLFLIAATLAVFWQVTNHEFINFDDDEYITENSHIHGGFTRAAVIWAFTTSHAANWHPLTWLSHLLDSQLYGLNPGGHHLTNLLFHLANTLLLFFVLKQMTGATWRSAFVAALFALHPLHVESVAWVAERKDVLSTFFWILTIWTYVHYAESPGFGRYLLILLSFALGLMAKPMLVTLPFVLLVLDYWPLGRFQLGQYGADGKEVTGAHVSIKKTNAVPLRVILEKAPLLALAAISSIITFFVQQQWGAAEFGEAFSVKIRIGNGLISYVSYIGKMIWPQHLAVFYPHPGTSLSMFQAAGAGLLLGSISIVILRAARRQPYLLVGWLWYLGTLVPVIGLVQVGAQAMADRYTYVPLIGLFIMIAWGVPDLLAHLHHRRLVLGMATGALLSTLMLCSWMQVQHWKNNVTLFEHALEVTADNYLAHDSLGNALAQQGKMDAAISHYYAALKIRPNSIIIHNNLGVSLVERGEIAKAMNHYHQALRLKSDSPEAHNNLGVALFSMGEVDKAIAHYRTAVKLDPKYGKAYNNLGNALARQGELNEAIIYYSRALETRVHYPEAHNNLGVALARQGRLDEAIVQFEKALRLQPDYAQARTNLSIALEVVGKTPLAPSSSANE